MFGKTYQPVVKHLLCDRPARPYDLYLASRLNHHNPRASYLKSKLSYHLMFGTKMEYEKIRPNPYPSLQAL